MYKRFALAAIALIITLTPVSASAAGGSIFGTLPGGEELASSVPAFEDYVIKWTDPVTERAARKILGRPSGDIKCSELDFVTELTITDNRYVDCNGTSYEMGFLYNDYLTTLRDIGHFRKLKSFSMSYHQGTDFKDAPELPALTELSIFICSDLKNFSGLKGYTGLNKLNLYASEADDFSFLSGMIRLEELDIARTGIVDLSPLEGMERLRVLKIYGNEKLTTVAPLAGLPALEQVTMGFEVKDAHVLNGVDVKKFAAS